MRTGIPSEVLAGFCGYRTTASSWRGSTLLAADIPIMSGRAVWRAQQDVPDTVTFRVSRFVNDGVNTFDWLPAEGDYTHPLAPMGQEVVIKAIVTSDLTGIEYHAVLGRYQIQEAEESKPGVVVVQASGMLQVVADDIFDTPQVPRADGTLFSEFRRLIPIGLGASIASTLVDRACPQSIAWSEDRLAALQSIADALPALLRTDSTGQIVLRPTLDDSPTPLLTLSDGELAPWNPYPVVVGKATRQDRTSVYNSWVARGTATDDPTRPPVQATKNQETGPFAVDPNGFRTRRAIMASPLLNTEAECLAAATTRLRNGLRAASVVPVELAPDPRIELDDAEQVRTDLVDGVWGFDVTGYVVGIELPLGLDDGPMRIDVGVG